MTIANLTGTLGQTGVTQARHMTVFQGMREGVTGCAVTPTATARQVSVAPGVVWFPGGSVEVTVDHADASTTATAQPSAGVRIDTLVMRFDTSANPVTAVLAWVAGTASTGIPQPPTLTRVKGGTWEVPLADARLAQNQGVLTAGIISDRRLTPAGLVFSATSTAALRDSLPGALCTVGGITYSCGADGVTWTPLTQQQTLTSYTPVLGGISGAGVSRVGRWYRDGPAVHVHGRITAAGTTSLTAGQQVTVSLPVVHGVGFGDGLGHGRWVDGGAVPAKVLSVRVDPGSSTARVEAHIWITGSSPVRLYNPEAAGLAWSATSGSYFDWAVTVYP